MPIIRVTSLPFENKDSASWPVKVCEYFSKGTEIPLKNVSVIWQLLPNCHYAYAGERANYQPFDSHPIIVEIMLPDFYALDRVEKIIKSAVDAINFASQMPKNNIFVQVNRARSGAVFDDGRIVKW